LYIIKVHFTQEDIEFQGNLSDINRLKRTMEKGRMFHQRVDEKIYVFLTSQIVYLEISPKKG
jgi:hypothetical protein